MPADPYASLVGMGYAGYASLDNLDLPFMPSSPTENDNLLKTDTQGHNSIANGIGEMIARDRRTLSISLTTPLSNRSLDLLKRTTYGWWTTGTNGTFHNFTFHLANGYGFSSTAAFVQTAAISASDSGQATVTFQIILHRWTLLSGDATTSKTKTRINIFNTAVYQPIPAWATTVTHTGQEGTALKYNLSFHNNWKFQQLCEATVRPPTPRVANPGPLTVELELTTLAKAQYFPLESGQVTLTFSTGAVVGMKLPGKVKILIPYMVRDSRGYEGAGDPNQPIHHNCKWLALGTSPSLTN